MKYTNDNVYIAEKGNFWRVNKNIIPYEFAKYKMPIFIQMNAGGFIPYYDITRKEMLYLSVRKKSQCGYQILSPEYSELLYDGQILDKYISSFFSVIRVGC